MIYKNKKGDFITQGIIFFIVLVVFFMLFEAPKAVIDAVIQYSPDSGTAFLLTLIVPVLLLGILKAIYSGGVGGGSEWKRY